MERYRRCVVFGIRALAIIALLLTLTVRSAVSTYRVVGTSMRETLMDGDRILTCELSWVVWPVRHGDTVVC